MIFVLSQSINFFKMRKNKVFRKEENLRKDERIQQLTEAFTNMKMLKLYGW